jgi:hypothetical protein
MADEPVKVTTGTQGAGARVAPGPGPSKKDPVVAKDDAPLEGRVNVEEEAESLAKPVEKDGSVNAKWGHEPEMRRVEDGDGAPRWRAEDGPPADGFVEHVPPERGLDP